MRLFLSLFFITFAVSSFSQSFDKSLVKEKKPIAVIRHKFNPQLHTANVEMKTPDHRTCLTPEIHNELQIKYGLPTEGEFERQLKKLQEKYVAEKKASGIITIPVIVHVIHNGESLGTGANISAEQVESQIDVLNEDFRRISGTSGYNDHAEGADIEIEFALALRDEFGEELSEAGIHRVNGNRAFWEINGVEEKLKPLTIWNPKKYMNIWTVNFGGDLDDILGYAQFPSLSGLEGLANNGGLNKTDGVIIGYKYFGRTGTLAEQYDGGRTTTHEVGHWLGLRHIWGDGDCSVDDYCEDTPLASHPNYICEPINSCGLLGDDMIENYMDYTPDACMNIFTQDQKQRMRTVIQVSPRRKELLASDVHLALQRPVAIFNTDKTEVCSEETIQFTDNSLNSPTSWEWTFFDSEGGEVATFSDENPTLIFNGIGVYGVELIVSNSFGKDTVFEANYISVLSSENQALPYSEDFEADIVLSNWVAHNPDGDRTWDFSNNVSSSGGTWSIYMDNFSDADGDPTGNFDALFSSSLDLSVNQDAYLTFDVAYAAYGGEYSDTLVIYASSDCGESFYPIWYKGGSDLATADPTQESFLPESDEWANERISLKSLNGNADIHIAIVNWSGWGNNLYIDNINIFTPSYTNPSTSNFYTPFDTVSVGSTVGYADYSGNYPTQWMWDFEGGSPASSSDQIAYVQYNTVGTFDVSLSTSNESGGDTYNCTECITIVEKPLISSSSNRVNNTICLGDSIELSAEGGIYYEWYDERGYLVSWEREIVVYPRKSTRFKVIGYDRFWGTNTSIETVTVNDLPSFDLGQDTTIGENRTLELEIGQDFSSYLWSDNTTGNTFQFDASEYGIGSFEIWATVTNQNACQSTDTITIEVDQSDGIIPIPNTSSAIKVYPNPTEGLINIEMKNQAGEIYCEIINSSGQILKTVELYNDLELIDITGFPPGFYNLRFFNSEFSKSMSIIRVTR